MVVGAGSFGASDKAKGVAISPMDAVTVSVLILETVDLPDKSSVGFSAFPANLSVGFQKLDKHENSSYGVNAGYSNAKLYNRTVQQNPDYFHAPEYVGLDANYRIKIGKTGMLKIFVNYGYNRLGMRNPDIDSLNLLSMFEVKGENLYSNISYRESLKSMENIFKTLTIIYLRFLLKPIFTYKRISLRKWD